MDEAAIERESMEFDVVIVGAGPSGVAAAVRLRQLAEERGHDLSVCVVEKGSEVGAHILSGAVLEPRALEELFPGWVERQRPQVISPNHPEDLRSAVSLTRRLLERSIHNTTTPLQRQRDIDIGL